MNLNDDFYVHKGDNTRISLLNFDTNFEPWSWIWLVCVHVLVAISPPHQFVTLKGTQRRSNNGEEDRKEGVWA